MSKANPANSRVSWAAAHAPVWRFLGVFALLLGGFYALVLLAPVDRLYYEYLRANAWLANAVLCGLGQHTEVSEVTIRAARFAVSVRRGCDAVEPAWFFCAAVLAFPAPWRRKPAALIAGATAILALNIVRIVSLFVIGSRWPAAFGPVHLEIWPVVFIALALVLWIRWIRSTLRRDSHAAA